MMSQHIAFLRCSILTLLVKGSDVNHQDIFLVLLDFKNQKLKDFLDLFQLRCFTLFIKSRTTYLYMYMYEHLSTQIPLTSLRRSLYGVLC